MQRQREGAAAAGFTNDMHADLGSGLPFSDRLSLVTAGVGGLVEHAKERADMRAKQGRSIPEADRAGLLALAGSLTELAAEPEDEDEAPEPTTEPTPEPRDAVAGNRARIQLALAELGA
jgi:hypothetical protein